MPIATFAAWCSCLLATTSVLASHTGGDTDGEPSVDHVLSCHPGEHGHLEGGALTVPSRPASQLAGGVVDVQTILDNGPSSNRVDLVFVGDGFMEEDLVEYATKCESALAALFSYEPFLSYRPFFNAHRVDVVSPERFVDNDPTEGISRNTALDMGFWCSGIERLLCVSVAAAKQAASAAPDADQILPMAFSTKYGGAGYYAEDIATFSSHNPLSIEIAIHELGHSLGDLADEYDYADGTTWFGGEMAESNVSILEARQMAKLERKWHRWLGFDQPEIGIHDTFEGARYFQFGIFRPTSDSMMRTLQRQFNMPGREALIIEISKMVDLIDQRTPSEVTIPINKVASVRGVEPLHGLDYSWSVNGSSLDQHEREIDLASVSDIKPGDQLTVTVTDMTDMVRSEIDRLSFMQSTAHWVVTAPSADLNDDGEVGNADFGLLLADWFETSSPADLNMDGIVNGGDISELLVQWTN